MMCAGSSKLRCTQTLQPTNRSRTTLPLSCWTRPAASRSSTCQQVGGWLRAGGRQRQGAGVLHLAAAQQQQQRRCSTESLQAPACRQCSGNASLTRPHIPAAALPAATFPYPSNKTQATSLGWGSLISDGFWPQVHSDALELLPWAHCSGLQAAFDPSPDGMVGRACTGKRLG